MRALRLVIPLGLAVGLLALVAWWALPPDAGHELRARTPALVRVARGPLAGTAGAEAWRLTTDRGEVLDAIWNPAQPTTGRPWVAVLLGGMHTGDRAALLLPGSPPVGTLALDWPWDGPPRMSTLELVRRLPAVREALLSSPGAIAVGVAAVRREAATYAPRIAVVGVSLGVPPALAALSTGANPDALVLIDGGADLRSQLAMRLERHLPHLLADPLAALAARLIDPLEPARHFEAARTVPTLVINARGEQRLPATAVARLHAGLSQAERRWHEGKHIRPERLADVRELALEASEWLEGLPAAAPDAAYRQNKPPEP